MRKAIEEMEKIVRGLELETGKKCNMLVALQLDDGKHHAQQVRLDVPDDHHFLDILTGIHETWWKSKHETPLVEIES